MKYNNEFKKINTSDKAYLLGLFYADGCVSINKKRKITHNYISYTAKISLIDKNLIDNLHNKFPFFIKGITDFSKYNRNNKIQYRIESSIKDLNQDLINQGVLPRKSYENKIKVRLPKLSDTLLFDFIRGYFDGDGTIYNTKSRPKHYKVEFYSVSKIFLIQLKDFLETKLNIKVNFRKKENNKSKIFILYILKNKDIIRLRKALYKNYDCLKLHRKYNKFIKVKDKSCFESRIENTIKKNKINNIKCPYCTSNHVTKSGKCHKTHKQRYLCKTCYKKFNQAYLKFGEFKENPEMDNLEPSQT